MKRMSLAILLFVFVIPSSAWSKPAQIRTGTVQVESGSVEGVLDGGLTVYKSIPFAAPPVAELRWRAPKLPLRWSGVRATDKFGPICMQSGASVPGAAEEPVSEDCLTLSIWTAAKSRDDNLPVMVWIPGGGFTQESGSMLVGVALCV
jgi:para-nitrobenzyl esterase